MKTIYPSKKINTHQKWRSFIKMRNYEFKSSRVARAYFQWMNEK